MKITITATLTEEQINILATLKNYPEEVTIFEDVLTKYAEYTDFDGVFFPASESLVPTAKQISNPQSREDYIRQVYEGIIIADATRELTNFAKSQREEQNRIEEQNIQNLVSSSITSSIE